MKRRINQWISIQIAKYPGRVVILAILLFNIVFFLLSALIISQFSLSGTENMGFLQAAFCTITMILDAGCIQFVIEDIGQSGVITALICLIIVIIGMISFTGAVIGYVTNYISSFIENANDGYRKLHVRDHVVILNWNTRASEIINDLLYSETPENVVVLTSSGKTEIVREIHERITDTIHRENDCLYKSLSNEPFLFRNIRYLKTRLKNRVTVVVREGDVFSSKQLHDISLEYAKMIVILGNDLNDSECKYEYMQKRSEKDKGDAHTIKTLMQVADITGASYSSDNQKIIVEITDEWTWLLVDKIIKSKQVKGKCNIVPVKVNEILGQILSQFSLMPELNLAYRELFSNKGAAFYSIPKESEDDVKYIRSYLATHRHAIPLTFMDSGNQSYSFYSAGSEKDIFNESVEESVAVEVKLNRDYWIEKKSIIIIGHNSKCHDIMQGFASFRDEWNYRDGENEILQIIVIDEKENLEKEEYYKDYPFVIKTVEAGVYDRELIYETIYQLIEQNEEDTSILILSDDMVSHEDIDANALTNLVYVQDIIYDKIRNEPEFNPESIDVIVEIIDPKHHDVISTYSTNNVVISNRFISKMITQIGEKEALFDFYKDILSYDEAGVEVYESKEIYVKKVNRFFDVIPEKCKAYDLIRAVFNASTDPSIPKEKQNPTLVLGYVKPGGNIILFEGDQSDVDVELQEKDKLIVFSNH